MGQNLDDYPDFLPKITHPKHFCRQCSPWYRHSISKVNSRKSYIMLQRQNKIVVSWVCFTRHKLRQIVFFFIIPVGRVLIITRLHTSRNPLWTALYIRKKRRKIKSSCNSIDVNTLIPQYEQHQATLIECLYWFSLEGSPVRHHMETHERFSESLRILWWWWFCLPKTFSSQSINQYEQQRLPRGLYEKRDIEMLKVMPKNTADSDSP